MRSNDFWMVLALPLLSACGEVDPSGIWLLQSPLDDATTGCEVQHGENYVYGQWPVEDDTEVQTDWTYTEESTGGDELTFGQIETMGEDEAVMLIGDTIIPGVWKEASAQWVFTWVDERSAEDGESHSAGYDFSASEQSSATLEVRFALIDEDHANGKISNTSVGRTTWTETDVWDSSAVGVSYSQIPSTTYLEGIDDTVTSVDNASTASDCEDGECNLWLQSTCTIDDDFTATRTDYADEDAFSYLQYATQAGD